MESTLIDRMKRLVEDLDERIYQLKSFDSGYEVNAYFDDLEIEVIQTVESAIQHLNQVQVVLLDKINAQREIILDRETVPLRSYRRSKESLQHDIETLSSDLKELSEKCHAESSIRSNIDEIVAEVQQQINTYKQRISEIRLGLKKLAFKGRFMKFKKNEWFFMDDDLVGSLEPCEIDVEDSRIETQIKLTKQIEYKNIKGINIPTFLNNRSLVVPFGDSIHRWDPKSNELKHLFDVPTNFLFCFLEIPGGFLAAGTEQGNILIIDIEAHCVVNASSAHSGCVCVLQLLPDNSLLSFSYSDGLIKIWRIGFNFELILQTSILQAGGLRRIASLKGSIITLSRMNPHFCISFWNLKDGRLLKQVEIVSEVVACACLLPRERVAISTYKNGIKILNIHDGSELSSLKTREFACTMIYLPSGHLIAGVENNLKIYDPNTLNIVQIVPVNDIPCYDDIIHCLLSTDAAYLYVATRLDAVSVWAISYT